MPNWCDNKLVISGPKDGLVRFDKAFRGRYVPWTKDIPTDERYCLNALYPVPDEVLAVGYVSRKWSIAALFKPKKSHDGYTWCDSHWGTKWDIDQVQQQWLSDTSIQYAFETAWAPIVPWVEKVASDWPDLTFDLYYFEPGAWFAGHLSVGAKYGAIHCNLEEDEEVRSFTAKHFEYMEDDEEEW